MQRTLTRAAVLATGLLGAASSLAAPAALGCRTLATDAVIERCVGDRYDAQEALHAVMRRLLRNVATGQRGPLKKAERAWEAYRDAQCAWEAGEISAARDDCLTRLMKGRIKQLTLIATAP